MKKHPLADKIVWEVIDQFIKDWQQTPNDWINEIEIQAELYSRIRLAFRLMNIDNIEANYYKDGKGNRYLEKGNIVKEFWSRVSLEPKIYYPDEKNVCHPDIVIWDDLENRNEPPDGKVFIGNFPILIAIEIKTNAECLVKPYDIPDIKKLSSLLKPDTVSDEDTYRTMKYGVWLNFHYNEGTDVKPNPIDKGVTIWVYDIFSDKVNPSQKRKLKGQNNAR